MNLVQYAKDELALCFPNPGEIQEQINKHIISMVQLFADEGHSGSSASYTISLLTKLLRFEPLSPLTGEDSEWVAVTDTLFQDKRCPHVFKDLDGQAYDANGKVFLDEDGNGYTNSDSRVNITFPYTPETEYVQVSQ